MYLHHQYSTQFDDCQVGEELVDVSSTGKAREWSLKKLQNTYLATLYEVFNQKKAQRLRECASFLVFKKLVVEKRMKLKTANFCRVRLCPLCQWRRSLKVYNQLRKVSDMATENGYVFIFVTLTVKNCQGCDLSNALDCITRNFNLLTKYKEIENAWQGYFRSLEVTHNIENDTYHPHLHVMVAVNKSYFSSKSYISQAKMTALWKKALKVDYEPQVDIRRIKTTEAKALAEVAKYAVKPSDFLYFDDWQMSLDSVKVLDSALNNRRFVGLGGVMREYHKLLNLTDVEEDANLINVDEEDEPIDESQGELVYAWLSGYSQYRRMI